jgi:hypothetical protein
MTRFGPILAAALSASAAVLQDLPAQTLPDQTLPAEADIFLWLRPGAPAGVALGLVLEGVPLDGRNAAMQTPLHRAAAISADPALIRAMIARGADPAAVDGTGRTPLHEAASQNPAPAIAAALAAGGAPLDFPDGAGRTALHVARAPAVAALLVLAGADACRRDGAGHPALSAGMLEAIRTAAPDAYGAAQAAFLDCL